MRTDVRYPAKPIDRPGHISVLTPTRSRPDCLVRLFDNFQETITDKDRFDVWLYVDDDDSVTQAFISTNLWQQYDFAIHWHVAPPTRSMGEMFNQLWQINSTNPGIYFPCGDDVIIATKGWDLILRESFAACKDGIMLGFPPEQAAAPYQVTYPIPSAQWLNILGYFITDRFFYWFDDMWLDDIAQMIGRKTLIPLYINNPDGKGKTPRMRNLPFWTRYYWATLEERYADACKLLDAIYTDSEEARAHAGIQARKAAAVQLHKNRLIDTDAIQTMEEELHCHTSSHSSEQLIRYLDCELMAVHDLLYKLSKALSRGETTDVIALSDFLETSSYRIPDASYIKALQLDSLGCHREAANSIRHGLQFFPNDTKSIELLRLMEQKAGDTGHCSFTAGERILETPAWLEIADPSFLLFPEEIDQELFFILQRILYDDVSVTTCLDIGASTGNGSTRAIVEATAKRDDVRIFCIEPETERFKLLTEKHAGSIQAYKGLSVSRHDYLSEAELQDFYGHTQSVYNFYPYAYIVEIYTSELASIRDMAEQDSLIKRIKDQEQIHTFDLVVMDGSLFTGTADLAAVYGAHYLILNYIWSTKNYQNLELLLHDKNYKVATANLKNRCGYVVFEKITPNITTAETHPSW